LESIVPNCLVLNGHPLDPSFNASLADRYQVTLEEAGISVQRLDIGALTVPDLTTRKPGDAEMTGDVARVWAAMEWADHVVIIHPLWWGGMPAKLKALFDIVLQSGKSFRYEAKSPLPLGLLKGRSARMIITSDTPGWFMTLAYGNAHFRAMKNQILRFIGLGPVRLSHISVMRNSSPAQRDRFLQHVATTAGRDAARLLKRKA
jgi:NAD(P)H dehydrogenase (quinone)